MRSSTRNIMLASTLAFVTVPALARAGTIQVSPPLGQGATVPDDTIAADGRCSIGEAIQSANTDAPVNECPAGSFSDDIVLPAGTFYMSRAHEIFGSHGITIAGAGMGKTILDGRAGGHPAFTIGNADGTGHSLTSLFGLTLQNYNAFGVVVRAAAIVSIASAKLDRLTGAMSGGGTAVHNSGSVYLDTTTITNCGGTPRAGALGNSVGAFMSIANSTLSGNTATQYGAAVSNNGTLEVYNSTFTNNAAKLGGGAISNSGQATIWNSTIAYNKTTDASTVGGGGLSSTGTTIIYNSILAKNTTVPGGKPDCSGNITSGGYNIFGSATGCSISAGPEDRHTDPMLASSLQSYGTDQLLLRPLTGSPAIDGGNPNAVDLASGGCLAHDQRGVRRLADGNKDGTGRCDIGAFEVGAALLVADSTSLSTGDAAVRTRLESLGFVVFPGDDDAMTAANTAGKNLVILSETGSSTTMGSRFRDVPTPVMVLEPGVFDDMAMTTTAADAYGTTTGMTKITMVDSYHYTTAGLAGTVTTTTSAQPYGWGRHLAPGAKCVARPSADSSRCYIFRIGKGDWLSNNTKATARRLGFFATRNVCPALTTAGWRLFDASVLWLAAGKGA